jgi:hypothetical protein
VTADFERWLCEVAPADEQDLGARAVDAERVLREVFDRRGPIFVEQLSAHWLQIQMDLAQRAVVLVLRDLHATTNLRPDVDLRQDEEFGPIVSYNGGFTAPDFMSVARPEATCEIADYLQAWIVDDAAVWTAWPTCPRDGDGVHAKVHAQAGVWYCTIGKHGLAEIGQLTRSPRQERAFDLGIRSRTLACGIIGAGRRRSG